MRTTALAAALIALAALSCAPRPSTPAAQERLASGDLEGARVLLEAERGRRPRSADVRIELGEVYYRMARSALDGERDEARYLEYLEHSVDEFVTALEIEPRDDRPHFYLAVMDTYRGDLRRALRGFNNARRLQPSGVAYTNIAEIYIYMGHLNKSRQWNRMGQRKGAPYGALVFNDMLLAWKRGDLQDARSDFNTLRRDYPEMVRTINVAELPVAPRTFEDFAGYCCGSPACGPYMVDACKALELDVQERTISEEAVLKELRIEMERTRRLRKVYEQRKELEIQVEEPTAGEGAP